MKVTIIGGSGYAGGELCRLLLQHPEAEIKYVTSRKNVGKLVSLINPNLDNRTDLKFVVPNLDVVTEDVDVVFLAMPHGDSQKIITPLLEKKVRVIDLSADFRLKDQQRYEYFYGLMSASILLPVPFTASPSSTRRRSRTRSSLPFLVATRLLLSTASFP